MYCVFRWYLIAIYVWLKHDTCPFLDSALGSRPKSPKSPSTQPDSVPSAISASIDDEMKHLKEEVKSLKADYANQFTELKNLVNVQANKISALEKELDELKKSIAK